MSQNFETTVGDNPQLLLSDSPRPEDEKVANSNDNNCGATETTKQIVKTKLRASNVKQTNYKYTLESFTCALKNLHSSFKPLQKNVHVEQSASKNDVEFEDLETAVKNVVGTQLTSAIQSAKSTGPALEKDHLPYVSGLRTPAYNTCFGDDKSHAAIGAAYDCASKIFSEISDANAKYDFWLTEIVREDEFRDLAAVREYLARNFREQSSDRVLDLDSFRDRFASKLTRIVEEVEAQNRAAEEDAAIERDRSEESEIESFARYERETAAEIARLNAENRKTMMAAGENRQQVRELLEELETRNRSLAGAKDAVVLLTKERNDLISVIDKMRVNDEDYRWLEMNVARHQAKNKHLRSVIDGTNDDTYLSLE